MATTTTKMATTEEEVSMTTLTARLIDPDGMLRGAGKCFGNCPYCKGVYLECSCKLGSDPIFKLLSMVHNLGALLVLLTEPLYQEVLRKKSSELLDLVPYLFPNRSEKRRSYTTVFTNSLLFQRVHNAFQRVVVPSSVRFQKDLVTLLTSIKKKKTDGTSRFDFPVSAWEDLFQHLDTFLNGVPLSGYEKERRKRVLENAKQVLKTWERRTALKQKELKEKKLNSSSGGGGGGA